MSRYIAYVIVNLEITTSGVAALSQIKRYLEIDVLRTFAIISMVFCHYSEIFTYRSGASGWIKFVADDFIGDFAAPLFLFLVGISLVISEDHARQKGALYSQPRKLVIRAAFIFAAGIVFRVLNYGPHDILAFGVLSFIGLVTLMFLFLRKMSSVSLLVMIVVVYFASPFLRACVPESMAMWKAGFAPITVDGWWHTVSGYFVQTALTYHNVHLENSIPQFFFSLFLSGEFPVFPWIIYPAAGIILGRKIVTGKDAGAIRPLALISVIMCLAGIAMACIGATRPLSNQATGFLTLFSFFPTSPPLMALGMGVVFGLYVIVWKVCRSDFSFKRFDLSPVFSRISKYSLTLYFFHHTLAFWFIGVLGMATGTDYFGRLTTPFGSCLISAGFLAAMYALLIRWDRSNGKYSLEWLLKRVEISG
ncbi:MAG: heparan-alpha-glucosaminide N-acetyltransferase domain-containing protein [Myxococcota bacterium]